MQAALGGSERAVDEVRIFAVQFLQLLAGFSPADQELDDLIAQEIEPVPVPFSLGFFAAVLLACICCAQDLRLSPPPPHTPPHAQVQALMADAKVDPQLTTWPTLEKNASIWAKKILIIECLRHTVLKYGEDHFFDGLEIKSKPPISWWTAHHDSAFLLGSLKHGIGKQDAIRHDPALPFFALCRQVDADGTIQCKWPQPLALAGRFKTLMQAIRERDDDGKAIKRERSGGTKRKGEDDGESSRSQDQKRTRKAGRGSEHWSDQETQDLIDAMMAFGAIRPESWDAVCSHHPILAGIPRHKHTHTHT